MKKSNHTLPESMARFMGAGDNHTDRMAYRKLLLRMMEDFLTPRQRDCLKEYYIEEKTQAQIAEKLDVSPSCVSKHLKAGLHRLRHMADYVCELARLLERK